MKLYVANCTNQDVLFACRIIEMNGVKTFQIRIGGQTQIAGDLTHIQVDGIIEQHRKYGMVSVEEFERIKVFVPYVFSIDRPVKAELIQRVMALNTSTLKAQGAKMRKDAAIAVNNVIEEANPALEALEMSVEEERRGGFTDGSPLSEGIRVTRNANPDGSPIERSGKGKGRRAA